MRSLSSPHQDDLFHKAVFSSRDRSDRLDADRFRLKIKQAMSQALNDHDRHVIARDMGQMLGQSSLSKGMLDSYTSPSKNHDISLIRFKALVKCTGANSLWDVAVSDDGLLILQGDEPRLAEIARLQQAQREIGVALKRLTALPVHIRSR
jgi:hypothetical protein